MGGLPSCGLACWLSHPTRIASPPTAARSPHTQVDQYATIDTQSLMVTYEGRWVKNTVAVDTAGGRSWCSCTCPRACPAQGLPSSGPALLLTPTPDASATNLGEYHQHKPTRHASAFKGANRFHFNADRSRITAIDGARARGEGARGTLVGAAAT